MAIVSDRRKVYYGFLSYRPFPIIGIPRGAKKTGERSDAEG
jgi:hypothetical protein